MHTGLREKKYDVLLNTISAEKDPFNYNHKKNVRFQELIITRANSSIVVCHYIVIKFKKLII